MYGDAGLPKEVMLASLAITGAVVALCSIRNIGGYQKRSEPRGGPGVAYSDG